jgi:hypothetical protein
MLSGSRYGFHGRFDLAGNAAVIVRRDAFTGYQLRLHLDVDNRTDQVSGAVTDGNWVSDLAGDRNIFNARVHPAQQAGLRTFTLERAEDASTAAAGSSRITAGGLTRIKGNLADGRSFANASALAKNGDCPFYLSLNRGTEVVIGWLNYPVGQAPAANGSVLWVKTGTNSFAATLTALSSPQ